MAENAFNCIIHYSAESIQTSAQSFFANMLNIPHYKTLDIQPLSIIVLNASSPH